MPQKFCGIQVRAFDGRFKTFTLLSWSQCATTLEVHFVHFEDHCPAFFLSFNFLEVLRFDDAIYFLKMVHWWWLFFHLTSEHFSKRMVINCKLPTGVFFLCLSWSRGCFFAWQHFSQWWFRTLLIHILVPDVPWEIICASFLDGVSLWYQVVLKYSYNCLYRCSWYLQLFGNCS